MKTSSKVIIGIIIAIILSTITGIITFIIINKENKIENNNDYAVEDECIDEEYMYETGLFEDDLEASSAEIKISPNANLIIKKKHMDCGHITEDLVEIPTEMVNKTQEEIEEMYPDFNIDAFSSNEVILYKEVEGICNEHYKIKEEDGVIVIYTTNEKGEDVLYDKTGIATEYLAEQDLSNIRNEFEIYGKENLNKFIEDFE